LIFILYNVIVKRIGGIDMGALIPWIPRIIAIVAAIYFWKADVILLSIVSIIILIIIWLTNNYITSRGQEALRNGEAFNYDQAANLVPDWIASISMIATLAAIILLIISLIVYY
jgi:hypothetical protein